MKKFFEREEGLVTIEWIGVAAVMLVAAIGIASLAMGGAETAADTLGDKASAATANANADTFPDFGDGAAN